MSIYDSGIYQFFTGLLNDVAWLYILLPCVFVGGIYLTIGSGAVQFRRFGFAMKNTAGKLFHKQESAKGSVTPLQAVTTALAATVGTGNIVGTSQAIAMGGYGAVFWLWIAALLGMVIKYAEVTLAIQYRERDAHGDWVGGPMYYIENGMGPKWKWLAAAFSILAALASFGIGNMSQSNSIVGSINNAVTALVPGFTGQVVLNWVVGILLAAMTGLVLFGGIKRIGAVTEKLIPFMSIAYILMTLFVILFNLKGVGPAFGKIFSAAFTPRAVLGGAAGITLRQAVVWGLRRSAFSNEAGLGSAPIAHATTSETDPVKQGLYGIFEVFMDTIVICSLSGLTVLCAMKGTGLELLDYGNKAAATTNVNAQALGTVFGVKGGALIIAIGIGLFAFSTVLGWSLYGARCCEFVLGTKSIKPYYAIFVVVVFIGATMDLALAWDIADTLNGLMAIPNLIGVLVLSPKVVKETKRHFRGEEFVPQSDWKD